MKMHRPYKRGLAKRDIEPSKIKVEAVENIWYCCFELGALCLIFS